MKTKAGKIIAKVPDIQLGRITEEQWAQRPKAVIKKSKVND